MYDLRYGTICYSNGYNRTLNKANTILFAVNNSLNSTKLLENMKHDLINNALAIQISKPAVKNILKNMINLLVDRLSSYGNGGS